MKTTRFNIFISTLNFVLLFVGYQVITGIFLPSSSDLEGISRAVTIPYRAFALLISLLAIGLNLKRKSIKFPIGLKLLLVYWGLLIIRIFYDLNLREDIYIRESFQLWMFIFGMCIPAIISVYKSFEAINLDLAFYWIIGLIALTLVITFFSNQTLLMNSEELIGRQSANIALNTISFGHLGTMGIILALFFFTKRNTNLFMKVLLIIFIIMATFSMLRAGSRGPIFSLLIVLLFWMFSQRKDILIGLVSLILIFSVIFIFLEQILDFIGNVSPIMEDRLRASIYEKDTSAREPYYKYALQAFLEHPFLGKQFAIFRGEEGYIYPHNIMLEAFMATGIIGGGVFLTFLVISLKKSYILIKKNAEHFWLSLILIHQIMYNTTSGTFYENYLLSGLLCAIFIYYKINKTLLAPYTNKR